MTDLFGKIVGVFLAFLLLGCATLIIDTKIDEVGMKRSIYNEMTNFIDKTTDSGKISKRDLSDFYLGVSSHGVAMDAKIQRYVRVVNPDGAGGTYTTYTLSENINDWNKGDIIKITCKTIGYTSGQKFTHRLMGVSPSDTPYVLSGMVRN